MSSKKAKIFPPGNCMHFSGPSGLQCSHAAAGYIITADKRRRRLCDGCAKIKGVTNMMRPFQAGTIIFETLLLLVVAAWCVFMFMHAIETRADEGFSFALGAEVHGSLSAAGDIQYSRPFSRKWGWYAKMAYVNGGAAGSGGAVFKWNKKIYTQAGIGVRRADENIGTDWHYDLVPVGYCFTKKVCVEWNHRSNCKTFMQSISEKCWFVLPRGNSSKPNRALDVVQARVWW